MAKKQWYARILYYQVQKFAFKKSAKKMIKITWLENHHVKTSRSLSRKEAAWLIYMLRGCNDVNQKSIRIRHLKKQKCQ